MDDFNIPQSIIEKIQPLLPRHPSANYVNVPTALRLPSISETMSSLLDGESMVAALKQSVDELVASVPADHDVLVEAFGVRFDLIRYVPPHTLILRGYLGQNRSFVIAHFSQLVAHVVYLPKQGPERVITGFARGTQAS